MKRIPLNSSIFREYDIRGIAERELNSEFAKSLGLAYASYLKKRIHRSEFPNSEEMSISVGQDCRLTSPAYANALIEGLTQGGINVIRLGVCPTPLTYFSIFHLNLDGGIMVTGSHNPSEYNGFKICVGKETIHGQQIQELRKIIENEDNFDHQQQRQGTISEFAIIPAYTQFLCKNTTPLKKKKIVLDAGNGTAGSVAPLLFEKLGAEVIPLFCELDGRFPNHHPDPTVPDNLTDLIQVVQKEKADFGLAFDGDSDRLGVVNEKGEILFGDQMMILFSRELLKTQPGATIISEVKSSQKLYHDIAEKGGNPIMWKTGHSLIKAKMKETGAALAGEMSGHIFFADRYFGYDDAIYAGLRVYEILSKTDHPLSSLLQDLPETVVTPEIRVDCEEDKKFNLVERTRKTLELQFPIVDIDGVRVDFGDSWGLVRASNTQPVLVLRFEAPTSKRLEQIRQIVEKALHLAAEEIGHPPINPRTT